MIVLVYMRRTKEEVCIAPTTSNCEDGERHETLQRDYPNRFDWRDHNKQEERVFHDT